MQRIAKTVIMSLLVFLNTACNPDTASPTNAPTPSILPTSPSAPTRTPQPSRTPSPLKASTSVPTPAEATADDVCEQQWYQCSPNGKFYCVPKDTDSYPFSVLIVDMKQERQIELAGNYLWTGCWGWTSDSRYLVFSSGDQYGNDDVGAFDVLGWREVPDVRQVCDHFTHSIMGGECQQGGAAFAQMGSRILREDGELIYLPDATENRNLLVEAGEDVDLARIYIAAWSPSESHLAFVKSCRPHAICPDHALYPAEGDGTELQRVTTIDGYGKSIDWSPDGLWVSLRTKTSLYELNVTVGRLQITQLPTATVFPTSTVENDLSDSDK